MTSWVKYHSIKSIQSKKIIHNFTKTCGQNECCVTEKYHGANCSFFLNDGKICFGKRTSPIVTENDFKQFFNCYDLVQETIPQINKLFSLLKGKQLIVYGELIGGKYEGFKSDKYKPIQRGISYRPDYAFVFFDIMVDGNFLNYDKCIELFEKVGLYYAKILFRGTADECLKWSSEHRENPTFYPEEHKFPTLEDNIREGHVIKPLDQLFFKNGNRVYLKDKGIKFQEKKNDTQKEKKKSNSEDVEWKNYADNAILYVTKQRLANILSKFGTPEEKDVKKLCELLFQDVINDYTEEIQCPDLRKTIGKNGYTSFYREVKNSCLILVKNLFLTKKQSK
jgi:Rnl2 family RNA ligase